MPDTIDITWLGHATFLIRSVRGRTILIDPWVQNNPACPEDRKTIAQLDLMAITHGHFDHIGDAVAIAKATQPTVVCIHETGVWLTGKGVENVQGMNKGGTQDLGGIKFTMVGADHSCGIQDDDGSVVYGGDPCGFVIELENGFSLYHAGDTNVFSDMRIIGELYSPSIQLLPIGGLYTMSPREATYACTLLGAQRVIPMHYGTFPALPGTAAEFKELAEGISGLEIFAMDPGETISFDVADPRNFVRPGA